MHYSLSPKKTAKSLSHLFLCLFLLLSSISAPVALAENSGAANDVQQLLQKGLTIHEIDQEVQRLSEQDTQFANQIQANQAKLAELQGKTEDLRRRAGKVLVSYYTGQRNKLWLILFQAGSLTEALDLYEYLSAVMDGDRKALQSYKQNVQDIQKTNTNLEANRTRLNTVKQQLLDQRKRLVALQKQLDAELASRKDAEAIKRQIQEVNTSWEQKGLPVFKTYLQALSDAMDHFPKFISTYKDSLTMDGFNYSLEIQDQQLNEFLRNENPLFTQVTFAFEQNELVIKGMQDQMNVEIRGYFILEQKPENVLRFVITHLKFNGLELPDTRRNQLQEQFQLGVYPQKIASFLTATDVRIEANKLIIHFAFNLGQ
ncbi:hypothetical protein [Ferviditalea candida]|uniref:Uncharacterized protein n=1 Tax=Ferviditalea candida TaxID=3108399 RepID=A0ABU5ZDS5_9BACL|nr:hypothetical protein [Paenibacillaceae bacterium T2]